MLLVRISFPHPKVELSGLVESSLDLIAGGLLADLLRWELAGQGLWEGTGLTLSRLNGGMFIYEVSDLPAASLLILSILEPKKLKPYTTLFQYDPAEEVWRSFWPESGADVLICDLEKELEREKQRSAAAVREGLGCILKSPGDAGGAQANFLDQGTPPQ